MQDTQKKIFIFYAIFILALSIFVFSLAQLSSSYSTNFLDFLIVFSFLSILYMIYHFQKIVENYNKLKNEQFQKLNFVVCPTCKVLQKFGSTKCDNCQEEWIICSLCSIPFYEHEKIRIAPCCGEGYHKLHFEEFIYEYGYCPSCKNEDIYSELYHNFK
ncbi:MAG: hypothetical protein IH840_00630 [Candidatus Heimdallarchaeota archaeon]|nr:hypothetical protein [Candidatus Heimdallarchaeota archaeon]